MRSEPILVVMAAGIGSRFGGIKQLASFGAHGECIIDYSLFDAYRAGFRRVIFIVRDDILEDFRQKIGCHVEGLMETHYVLQHLDHLPEGCTVPTGRTKPWGTGHAVMCCREYIDAPFAAIISSCDKGHRNRRRSRLRLSLLLPVCKRREPL